MGRAANASRAQHAAGFTAIEMMVVVALLAILSSLAVPAMQSFLAGQRVKTVSFDLTSDLLIARSEALKRNTTVTVQPLGEGWHFGWRVLSADDAAPLGVRNALGGTVRSSGGPASIVFAGNGRVIAPATRVNITIASTASDAQRCIELDLSGRARSSLGMCS